MAGKGTHSIAATRASVDRMRLAKVITRQGYEGREVLSGLSRSKAATSALPKRPYISNIPEIPFDIPSSPYQICCHEARRCRRPPGSPGQSDPAKHLPHAGAG